MKKILLALLSFALTLPLLAALDGVSTSSSGGGGGGGGAGDVYLASNQTFTGQNTFQTNIQLGQLVYVGEGTYSSLATATNQFVALDFVITNHFSEYDLALMDDPDETYTDAFVIGTAGYPLYATNCYARRAYPSPTLGTLIRSGSVYKVTTPELFVEHRGARNSGLNLRHSSGIIQMSDSIEDSDWYSGSGISGETGITTPAMQIIKPELSQYGGTYLVMMDPYHQAPGAVFSVTAPAYGWTKMHISPTLARHRYWSEHDNAYNGQETIAMEMGGYLAYDAFTILVGDDHDGNEDSQVVMQEVFEVGSGADRTDVYLEFYDESADTMFRLDGDTGTSGNSMTLNGSLILMDSTGTDTNLHVDEATGNVGIGTNAPSHTLEVNGDAKAHKLILGVTTVTTTSATAGQDAYILVDDDTAGSAVTITLPLISGNNLAGTQYHIKKLGTNANVIVDGNGAETVDGGANATLTSQYQAITVVCDGTSWFIF